MKEKLLLKISLATAIIGIVVLYFVSQNIEANQTTMNIIDGVEDGTVIITGTVLDINERNSTTFLQIEATETLPVIAFGKVPMLTPGDLVQVRGKMSKKDGKSSIISEEIRVI
jgi:DNA/RNA endonuclease YhcR with UshA esterase domain